MSISRDSINNTTTATNYYAPPFTSHMTQHQRVLDAYRLAGIPEPDITSELETLMTNEPTPEQIATSLANNVAAAEDGEAAYEEAITSITRAVAAQALQRPLREALKANRDKGLPAFVTNGVEALTPAFAKLGKAFTRAAQALPENNPLDPTQAIELGVANEYKTVRDTLKTLSVYAGIHKPVAEQLEACPRALGSLLAIVDLPPATTELRNPRTMREVGTILNDGELDGTKTIRALAQDASQNLDETLIKIAQGHYEGVTLTLATHKQLHERVLDARTAHSVETRQPKPTGPTLRILR